MSSFRGTKFNDFPSSNGAFKAQSNSQQSGLARHFQQFSNKVEDLLDIPQVKQLKPYVPQIGRFLIVATFYEDSLRILSQWGDQVYYLWNYRHIPYYLVVLLLLLVVCTMIVSSTLIVAKKFQLYAAGSLILIIIVQGFMYGLFTTSSTFILRNLSLAGGLLIAFSDTLVGEKRSFAGLPEVSSNNKYKNYVLLAGRILLVFMFFTFAATKSWLTIAIVSVGIFAIAFGFKTRFASIFLIAILMLYNFSSNNYWSSSLSGAKSDYLKYEFYQTLSIVGGLLLVVNTGAGELSFDEKKKIY